MPRDPWNRCDECGRFIPLAAFLPGGGAARVLVTPESLVTFETWDTLCPKHANKEACCAA